MRSRERLKRIEALEQQIEVKNAKIRMLEKQAQALVAEVACFRQEHLRAEHIRRGEPVDQDGVKFETRLQALTSYSEHAHRIYGQLVGEFVARENEYEALVMKCYGENRRDDG